MKWLRNLLIKWLGIDYLEARLESAAKKGKDMHDLHQRRWHALLIRKADQSSVGSLKTRLEKLEKIESNRAFIAADVGFNDSTAMIFIKRNPNGNNLVEIINLSPHTPWDEIQRWGAELAQRHGVRQDRFIIDKPYGFPKFKI